MPDYSVGNCWYTWPDGERLEWRGVSRCACYSCRQVFNSVGAFEHHRKKGQCNTEGMFKNSEGYWIIAPKPLHERRLSIPFASAMRAVVVDVKL